MNISGGNQLSCEWIKANLKGRQKKVLEQKETSDESPGFQNKNEDSTGGGESTQHIPPDPGYRSAESIVGTGGGPELSSSHASSPS